VRRSSTRAVFLLVVFASTSAHAFRLVIDDTPPGLRVSAGTDVFRAPGTLVASARYGGTWGARLGWWVHGGSDIQPRSPTLLAGADYMLTFWKKVRGGIGVAWIDRETNVNGTRWNFDATLAYDLSDRLFVEYRHQSHGAILGIGGNSPNGGWNVVGVGYTF
jgi:hypothetical protein